MSDTFGDARLEELTLLSEIERKPYTTLSPTKPPAFWDMVYFLAAGEYVTHFTVDWEHYDENTFYHLPGESQIERTLNHGRLSLLRNGVRMRRFG